ncbi:SGNH/GDSL hydrolase family protein [Rheinheimera soli]|uniref:Lysophospholipase L1-like esterase n=1 Tax=Rheinheimera soli TaxID=443616 RepID=A0ABU1VUG2_9GAMM|nr:SGNH/GDSL hydrolase family protein [Rheinheimera soli]MDR7119322.1 lysophospholipase L1-like esterase [Rheinheimera soli]
MKKNIRSVIAIPLLAAVVIVLSSCSGGDSATDTGVKPEPQPTPVIKNPLVDCGEYRIEPPTVLPWKLTRPSDWVVMGSSSAFGAGASAPEKSWVGLIRDYHSALGVTIHNIAKGGYSTYHALSKQCVVSASRPVADMQHNIDKAHEFKPDLVFLSYPSNDAVSKYTATESASNLLLLRWQLMQQGTAVVVLSSQPRNTNTAAQAALLELDKLLKPLVGACFVELHSLLVADTGGLATQFDSGDGVHLNDAGHQIVAQAINQTLNSGRCVEF